VNGTGKNFKQLETSEIGVGPPSGLYPDGESRPRQQPQQQQQNFFFGSMSHFSFNGVDYFDARLRRQLDEASSTTVEVTAREDDSPVEVLLPFTVRAPQAFAELPTLNLVDGFDLRLRFRTVQTDGLLLISAGGVSRSADFLLLELLNGRLRLALNPGLTSVATQRELPLEPGGRLDDNQWHLVELRRRNRQRLVFRVDGRPAGSAGFVGDVGDGGFNVNVNKNSLYLGGAPRHLMSARSDVILSGIGFQGCLGSVHLCGNQGNTANNADSSNSADLAASVCDVLDRRLNRNEFATDLVPSCQRPKIECHREMCYYGGQCLQQRDSVACLCDTTSFTGDWCNRVGSSTFQFGRQGRPGRLSFEFADDTFLPTTKRDDIAFGFQTAKESAPLLRVDARDRSSDYILISIVNQRIRVEYNMKSSTISLESSLVVSDGRYHRIRFLREETRGSLYIDDHTPLIKHPDASVGTTFNWQKYIQIGRLATAPKSGIRRRRRSSPAVADESQQYFQGYLVGLVFNGLPLNRIAAGDEAVKDLARLHIEREGDVQQVADFVPKLPGFPPVDRPEYYRNPDLMPTTVAPSPTPIRCSAENRYRMDCVNDARGVNLPDYQGGMGDRSQTHKPPAGAPESPSQTSQSSSSSGEGAAVDGDKTSAKPPVQAAKINVFVIVAVGAAGAILLLVFFCLIYRCRSKNEGSYRVDETQNFAADGIGGPGIQLDPALKPLRSDGSASSSSRRHANGDARGAVKSGSRGKRDMKECLGLGTTDAPGNQGQQRLGHLVHRRRLAPAGVRVGRCAAVGADGARPAALDHQQAGAGVAAERQGVVESGQNGLRQGVDSAVDAQHGAGLLVASCRREAKLTNSQMCRLNSAARGHQEAGSGDAVQQPDRPALADGAAMASRRSSASKLLMSSLAGRHQRAVVDAVVVADAQHEQQREQQDGGDQLVAAQQQRQVAEVCHVGNHSLRLRDSRGGHTVEDSLYALAATELAPDPLALEAGAAGRRFCPDRCIVGRGFRDRILFGRPRRSRDVSPQRENARRHSLWSNGTPELASHCRPTASLPAFAAVARYADVLLHFSASASGLFLRNQALVLLVKLERRVAAVLGQQVARLELVAIETGKLFHPFHNVAGAPDVQRNGPPRNGGKPRPNTAPMSPSSGVCSTPSCRHWTDSLTNRENRRHWILSMVFSAAGATRYFCMMARASSFSLRSPPLFLSPDRYVDADFISQRGDANRPAEALGGLVQLGGPDTLLQQADGFGQHWRQDPGGVESGPVANVDDQFALAEAEIHGGAQSLLAGLLGADDLQQLHLVHRREIVHADHLVRPLAALGDLGDGQGGGVAGEHAVRRDDGFDFLQYAVLDVDVFKHGLDNDVAAFQLGIVQGGVCLFAPMHRSRPDWICSWPRAKPASLASFITVARPLSMVTCAMPAPIRPAPRTPTHWVGRCGLPQRFFLVSVWPKNRPNSALDSGVAASSPNDCRCECGRMKAKFRQSGEAAREGRQIQWERERRQIQSERKGRRGGRFSPKGRGGEAADSVGKEGAERRQIQSERKGRRGGRFSPKGRGGEAADSVGKEGAERRQIQSERKGRRGGRFSRKGRGGEAADSVERKGRRGGRFSRKGRGGEAADSVGKEGAERRQIQSERKGRQIQWEREGRQIQWERKGRRGGSRRPHLSLQIEAELAVLRPLLTGLEQVDDLQRGGVQAASLLHDSGPGLPLEDELSIIAVARSAREGDRGVGFTRPLAKPDAVSTATSSSRRKVLFSGASSPGPSGSTSWCTRPMRLAFLAGTFLPCRIIDRASKAEQNLRQTEHSFLIVDGDAIVRSQGDLQSAAKALAHDGRHHGLLAVLQRLQVGLTGLGQLGDLGGGFARGQHLDAGLPEISTSAFTSELDSAALRADISSACDSLLSVFTLASGLSNFSTATPSRTLLLTCLSRAAVAMATRR
uniref:LAM_G_DOMAIN domain-containing protein n=1 Tax=Macrostomum lignano TaxID=282301 RepID=A0A1I8IQW9_9PLAT